MIVLEKSAFAVSEILSVRVLKDKGYVDTPKETLEVSRRDAELLIRFFANRDDSIEVDDRDDGFIRVADEDVPAGVFPVELSSSNLKCLPVQAGDCILFVHKPETVEAGASTVKGAEKR